MNSCTLVQSLCWVKRPDVEGLWLPDNKLNCEAMRTEPEIIQCISRRLGATSRRSAAAANPKWLRVGLGDDAAVLGLGEMAGHRQRSAQELALSCDSFLEGIHFLPELHSPQAIGYKALARATSDLAAMGVRPRFFLLMLSLPPDRTGPWLDQFIAGMRKAATECKMTLIGGDTSAYSRIAVGLTVGGYVRTGHALTRSGARPGDQIFVSGTLGSAQFGFECYSAKKRISRNAPAEEYVERHLHPRIRLALGQWLAGETHQCAKIASAAIDTSDGLSTDLGHICEESGVAAMIYSGQLPKVSISPGDGAIRGGKRFDALELALNGGEDYELLFTVPAEIAKRIPLRHRGVRLTRIGEIIARPRRDKSPCMELIDDTGRARALEPRGWDSFRRDD